MTAEELVAALVSIDSVNPDLIPGAAGEQEIAAFVAAWLREAGLEVEIDEAAPGRTSVVAIARGIGGGGSLMLNAHLDTSASRACGDRSRPRSATVGSTVAAPTT